MKNGNPLDVTPSNIGGFKQNHPMLVARDFKELFGVPEEATLRILLARGMVKWVAVRRELIRLNHRWKEELKGVEATKEAMRLAASATLDLKYKRKRRYDVARLRGMVNVMVRMRNELRALLHSTRWQWPDNDWAPPGFPPGKQPRERKVQ